MPTTPEGGLTAMRAQNLKDPCQAGSAELLGVSQAQQRLLSTVAAVDRPGNTVGLSSALDRVAAQPVNARDPVPAWANSAMDGYALRTGDLPSSGEGELPVAQRIPAGVAPGPLAPGTAARIFTGAPIPEGADAVLPQERCRETGGRVRIETSPPPGANIRPAGEDLQPGDPVIPAGRRIRPQDIGLAASAGIGALEVASPLRVAVVVTGDELVLPGQPPGPGQIPDANGPMLEALLARIGCEALPITTVADDPEGTRNALGRAAAEADLVLSSGGVSVGEEDHVRAAVSGQGQLELWRVAIKPGKPLAFGLLGETPFLGLPGNPVSLFVTFALFGAPLIRQLQGRDRIFPTALPVPAGLDRPHPGRREEYLRVRVENGQAVPFPNQGSGVLGGAAWADGLARIPADIPITAGKSIDYFPLGELLD